MGQRDRQADHVGQFIERIETGTFEFNFGE